MSERPTQQDPETIKAIAKRFAKNLNEWVADDQYEEAENDLIKALVRTRYHDFSAYRLCSEFERMTYEVDDSLFHILEGVSIIAHDETQNRVRAWVIAEGILPALAVGDQVSMPNVDGTIIRVDAETAEYVVQCPSVGHSGAAGYVVGFEIVRAL